MADDDVARFLERLARDPSLLQEMRVSPSQVLRRERILRPNDRQVLLDAARSGLLDKALRGRSARDRSMLLDVARRQIPLAQSVLAPRGRVAADEVVVLGIYLGGSPPTQSVIVGDDLEVHVALNASTSLPVPYRIWQLTTSDLSAKLVASGQVNVPSESVEGLPFNGDEIGFPWPKVAIPTDPSWETGLYALQLSLPGNKATNPLAEEAQPITALFALRPPKLLAYQHLK